MANQARPRANQNSYKLAIPVPRGRYPKPADWGRSEERGAASWLLTTRDGREAVQRELQLHVGIVESEQAEHDALTLDLDAQHWREHAASFQIAHQLRPRLGRLAIAVADGNQLLVAVRP